MPLDREPHRGATDDVEFGTHARECDGRPGFVKRHRSLRDTLGGWLAEQFGKGDGTRAGRPSSEVRGFPRARHLLAVPGTSAGEACLVGGHTQPTHSERLIIVL